MYDIPPDQIWMIVVGFVVAFFLAFGIGANDVANSFGTSVGSKVLSLRQACIFASIFETLGAVLLGAKVSDTIRKGIIDTDPYVNNTEQLMMGNVAALSGSCLWLFVATLLRLPVSATHSIVGATVGFALVAHGARGINWVKMSMIIGSWFVSPILAGVISTCLFLFVKRFILTKEKPLEHGLRLLPVFYSFTIVVNLFSAFYDGPELFGFDHIPLWGTFVISFGAGLIVLIVVRVLVVPWQRKSITERMNNLPPDEDCVYKESSLTEDGMKKESSAKDLEEGKSLVLREDGLLVDKSKLNGNGACNKMITLGNGAERNGAERNGCLKTDVSNENFKNVAEDNASEKPVINKLEESPLMENEYNVGAVTPKGQDSPTEMKKSPSELSNMQNGHGNRAAVKNGSIKSKGDMKSPHDQPRKPRRRTISYTEAVIAGSGDGRQQVKDDPASAMLFSFLQILTAIFGAFAHGGNDVSNAIGPLVSLWLIGTTQTITAKAMTPIWILFYGGVGISIGLWIWGRRVIKTLGEDLTKITPSSGFCIEIGSAFTVLVASNIGIPISTTHCKVGSVVFVGRFRSRENVDWSIFRNIVLAWVVTLPVSGAVSAAIMAGLQTLL